MCLFTTQIEPKIAKHNIKCWKFINDWTYKTWVPIMYYESGELEYNIILKPKNRQNEKLEHLDIKFNYIEEGFHAYLKKPDNNTTKHTYTFSRLRENFKLVRVIIPRGSEYYVGLDNDIVSSQIIVFKSFWDYIKWRLFR